MLEGLWPPPEGGVAFSQGPGFVEVQGSWPPPTPEGGFSPCGGGVVVGVVWGRLGWVRLG